MKLYGTVCLGFLVVFVCDDKQPTTVSDFCSQYKREIRLTNAEIDSLSRESVDQILSKNERFKRLCSQPDQKQMK